MAVEHIILVLVMILGLSLLAQPVSRLLHMPFASILVLLGYITSEIVTDAGIDTGIRSDSFQGAVALALALSLPTSLDYWWTIQSVAFGVVMFSLFVQAPTMHLLVKRLSLKE